MIFLKNYIQVVTGHVVTHSTTFDNLASNFFIIEFLRKYVFKFMIFYLKNIFKFQ
jgi:hypothetical protein